MSSPRPEAPVDPGEPGRALRVVRDGEGGRAAEDGRGGAAVLDPLAEYRRRRDAAVVGDPRAVARHRDTGRRTARERLEALLDPGSFLEIDMLRRGRPDGPHPGPATDGVVAGSGEIDGRRVVVYAQDATVSGGSLGAAHAEKIHKVMDMAVATGSPVIALDDSGGARIQEGVVALHGYGGLFRRSVAASGVVPQIAVVLGPCAGGAAYAPALADVTFMVRDTARMYLTGPDVVAAVTGERVDHEQLGGASVHGPVSGLATVVCDDEYACLDEVRRLVALLPRNNLEAPPAHRPCGAGDDERPGLEGLVPADPRRPYDVRDVLAEIVDDDEPFEFHEAWAPNVVCALARVDGEVVGVVANQPAVLAGVLDRAASEKAARFVRFCDAFGVPLLTLVDVPGFLPGVEQERSGVIRHGAQLLYAYCEATVPRIQVVLRKSYGGAYIVMDSRSVGCDLSLAWPGNEIAVMGAESAVDIVHRRELAAAEDPDATRRELLAAYRERYLHPYYAVERGLVDAVVEPGETRRMVARGFAALRGKRAERPARKHGNVPL